MDIHSLGLGCLKVFANFKQARRADLVVIFGGCLIVQ